MLAKNKKPNKVQIQIFIHSWLLHSSSWPETEITAFPCLAMGRTLTLMKICISHVTERPVNAIDLSPTHDTICSSSQTHLYTSFLSTFPYNMANVKSIKCMSAYVILTYCHELCVQFVIREVAWGLPRCPGCLHCWANCLFRWVLLAFYQDATVCLSI